MSLVYLVRTNQNHLKETNMEIFDLLEEIKKEVKTLEKLTQEDPFKKWLLTPKKYKNGNKQKNVS